MNISSLIKGFTGYLEELNEVSNKDYSTASSNVSIFMYSNEFKNYIADELDVDASIFSKSVSDILNMEIVNGKLVDKEEENNDTFTKNEDSTEDEANPIDASAESEDTILADGNEQTETAASEDAQGSIQTGESAETAQAMNEILNNLFQDSNVIESLDTDKSGDLNMEEISSFIDLIKGNDGNSEDVSLSDIISGIESLKQTSEAENNPIETNTEEQAEDVTEPASANETESSTPSSNSGNSVGGSSGGGGTVSGINNNTSSPDVKEKNLDNMSLEELKEAYSEAEGVRDSKQTAYDSAKSDAKTAIADSKTAEETAYNDYIEGLKEVEEEDENLSEQVDTLNTQINDKQDEIHQRKTDISDKKNEVNDAQHAYDTAKSTFESLDAALSALQSTDTSGMDSEQQAQLQANIAALTAQRDAAETAMNEAEENLNTKKQELDELENGGNGTTSLSDLEAELSDLETQMTELEAKILEAHPEIQELLTAYQDARQEHSNTINTADNAISKAQKDLESAQKEVDKIDTAIQNYNTNEIIKENSISPKDKYDEEEGQKLVDTAKQMLSRYGSTSGYCATGVSRTFQMAYGIQMGGNGCDWDTNMDKLVNQGMFTEVTGDYPSSGDLSNLPAGAVVCWEATGGTKGGGAQYGHVTIADGNGGEISDHYAPNIYKSVGGRDDTYRVFIPV